MRAFSVAAQNKSFRIFWLAQGISGVGASIYAVAMTWLVLELTSSAAALATLRTVSFLPALILSLPAGVLADRLDRRRTLMWCDLCRAIAMAVLLLAVASGSASFSLMLAVTFVIAALAAPFHPASLAYLSQLVSSERLVQANGLMQIVERLAGTVGTLVGGIMMEVLGSVANIATNIGSFLIGAAGSFLARPLLPQGKPDTRLSLSVMIGDIGRGIVFVRHSRLLIWCMGLFALSNLLFAPHIVLLPILVKDTLGAGAAGYGALQAAFSSGVMLGMFLVSSVAGQLTDTRSIAKLVVVGHIIEGMILVGVGLCTSLPLMVALFFLFGLTNGPLNILFVSAVQIAVPVDYRGRVFSMVGFVMPLMLVLGFQATALLHRLPAHLVITGSGLGLAVLSGLFVIVRRGMTIGGES